MKIKTSYLTGIALDYAVCLAAHDLAAAKIIQYSGQKGLVKFYPVISPSTDWNIAGPIIERERIRLEPREGEWQAQDWQDFKNNCGPTPLIAAMRCYVGSKLGDTVDIPDQLV